MTRPYQKPNGNTRQKNTSATTTVWVRHQLLLNCSVHIAFLKFSFGAICFPDIVTDISFDFCAKKRSEKNPSHQIGLLKRDSMQGSEKRECFENKPQKRANAQRGARTHDPEIKSFMLYRLS